MNRLRFVIWSCELNMQCCYRLTMCILLRVIKKALYKYRKNCSVCFVSYTVQTCTVTQTSDFARSDDWVLKGASFMNTVGFYLRSCAFQTSNHR
jgi:hypothetical protein